MPPFLALPRSSEVIPQIDEQVCRAYGQRSSLRLDLGTWIVAAAETSDEVAGRLGITAPPGLSAIVFGLSGS